MKQSDLSSIGREFDDAVRKRNLRSFKVKHRLAREAYLLRKKGGDYSIVVDEWDLFELERDREKIKNMKVEDLSNMAKLEVKVRLSKDFNNGEITVSDIASEQEYFEWKDWAKNECISLVESLPVFGKTAPTSYKPSTPTHTPKDYREERGNKSYVPTDITTKFLKGKQLEHALKLLNAGNITIGEVNALGSWEEQQALIYSNANKKVIFGK